VKSLSIICRFSRFAAASQLQPLSDSTDSDVVNKRTKTQLHAENVMRRLEDALRVLLGLGGRGQDAAPLGLELGERGGLNRRSKKSRKRYKKHTDTHAREK